MAPFFPPSQSSSFYASSSSFLSPYIKMIGISFLFFFFVASLEESSSGLEKSPRDSLSFLFSQAFVVRKFEELVLHGDRWVYLRLSACPYDWIWLSLRQKDFSEWCWAIARDWIYVDERKDTRSVGICMYIHLK